MTPVRGRGAMQIGSNVLGATIALIAGVGSVSADEITVADTTGDTGTPFAMLDGIATEQMSVQELAATRGASSGDSVFNVLFLRHDVTDQSVRGSFVDTADYLFGLDGPE